MRIKTVAILSPGDMGHAVGRNLGESGIDVITYLTGRSARTRELARQGKIRDVPSLRDLVCQSDLILSILVPEEARKVAELVSSVIKDVGKSTLFADCNAISPKTTAEIGSIVAQSGGRYVDASIIGGPPKGEKSPRLYVSGKHSSLMSAIDDKGFDVRQLGKTVGLASALKMCYAALTKGTVALYVAVLASAETMGITDKLTAELKDSQSTTYKLMESQVPSLHTKAFRWIGEMEEIAASFDTVGMTPKIHQGAAEIYRLINQAPFAHERPETLDSNRSLRETIKAIASLLDA